MKKNQKKMRGESVLRPGEPTKQSCNLYLSKIVINKLERLAKKAGISKSEFIEEFIRSIPETE
jgi:hypothetical protein